MFGLPRHSSALLTSFVAAACSSADNTGNAWSGMGDAATDTSSGGGNDGGMTAQDGSHGAQDGGGKQGPCGVTVGKTLCDMSLEGYMRDATSGLASSVAYSSFHLSDALAKGTEKYAMVFLGGFW